jgi:hypothetical protein
MYTESNRTVYGYLDRPIQPIDGEILQKGWINVLFEKIDDEIYPINQELLYDETKQVFLQDSYSELAFRSYKQLIEISSTSNRYYGERPNLTRYVTFGNQTSNTSPDLGFTFVFTKLPDPLSKITTLPVPPLTKYFFIVDNEVAHGPFKIEYSTEEKNSATKEYQSQSFVTGVISQATAKETGLGRTTPSNIAVFNYAVFKEKNINKIYTAAGLDFLFDIRALIQSDYETQPYLTTVEIIAYLQSIATKRVLPKEYISSITKDLKTSKLFYSDDSKKVIEHVCTEATKKDEWLMALISIVNTDDIGRDIIKKYFEAEKEKYVNDWDKVASKRHVEIQKKIDALGLERSLLESQVNDKRAEVSNIEREIQRKQEALANEADDAAIKREIEDRRAKLDKEIKQKKEEFESIKLETDKLKREKNLAQDVIALENDQQSLMRQVDKQKDARAEIQKLLKEDETELQIKLRKMIPFVSSIIQAPIESSVVLKKFNDVVVINEDISDSESAAKLTEAIIGNITHSFNKINNRNYTPSFLASILVATFQSRITIFSGPPGLGKTSFVRILKDAMTLNDRFIEVAVGRNWISERELIGFYNSLTNSFAESSAGVYSYLSGIADDTQETAPPHIMLLDEANLSPIEHYGASLLNISDKESDGAIQLAHKKVMIPDSFRVIATVNYDMTTEPLSPRLLDRAPVIPFDGEEDKAVVFSLSTNSGALNYSDSTFQRVFGESSYWLEGARLNELPVAIIKIAESLSLSSVEMGSPFIISHRKKEKIQNYITVLSNILTCVELLSQEALISAMDYAVLYYLLPMINGSGTGTHKRITETHRLLVEFGLVKSSAKLKDMIERGENNLDSFNFFIY